MPAPVPRAGPVDAIRSFNRFYTRKIGVLNAGLLDSPLSLTEVRILYEIAQRPGLTATDLLGELGLDAGYLSRTLAHFARRRLITRTRPARDRRHRQLHLTAAGRRTFAGLNRRSSEEISHLIGHLPPAEQERLAGFMQSIRILLAAPGELRGGIKLRDPKPGDLGWVVQRHGALYAQEYGWNESFEALVARIVADFVDERDPKRERCWIADLDGQPVGSVFLVCASETVAKLRLLLVDPSARGHGVGGRLVGACVEFARRAGYRKGCYGRTACCTPPATSTKRRASGASRQRSIAALATILLPRPGNSRWISARRFVV
ncbi:MAG TPA: bifunctional helix-turn-helix transcriptional regulator/GNAT family N-acetyltransferase [Lacunisphaera sp.]|nr:bifunctional helix-turn-helix transcriptional regulator/GNAT family N-acetyltransferase [Lacunisphaera sp.]